ncbi:MAG: ATPase, T2SS/T4P/T4SS family [Actinomycetota bacterium]|jgi:pilus assembly protein CpaF|nr:ATPase, T2SS/T4P/T4SS family [Actinomycetota bacterium]
MATAFEQLRGRVLGLLAARDIDVGADPGAARRLVESETERFQRQLMRGALAGLAPFVDPADVVERLMTELVGIGAQLDQLVEDPLVEEIYGFDGEITARLVGGATRYSEAPAQAGAVLAVLQRLVAAVGENFDASHPKVDGVRVILPGGRQARLSVSVPPRIDGTVSFSLRVPQKRNTTLRDLVSFGSLVPEAATFLEVLMRIRRVRMLVAGAPGAGKTTLLEALLRAAPPNRRTICAEEQRELNAPLLNGEYWQASKVESLADLVRSARVASPELIVLGELKGPEAWELLMAGTLGVGIVAAVHAEDTAGAFEALAVCATKAVPATPFAEIEARFAAMFDVVVYCDIDDSGELARRQITEIAVVPPQLSTATGGVAVTPIFSRSDIGEPMELRSGAVGERLERRCNRLLARYGLELADVLKGAEVVW